MIKEIAKKVAEEFDNEVAKLFVLEAMTKLKDNGIKIWYTQTKIDTKVDKSESGITYIDTYAIHFDALDTSEHDAKVRAEVINEVERAMYHQCFECDNNEDMQKWDSGNWLRYKLFENVMEQLKEKKNG